MFTRKELENTVAQCKYMNWNIKVRYDKDRPYLQVYFLAPDIKTGKLANQASRKWWLSYHMCKREIVDTVYAAIERATIHEIKENFQYDGVAIFNPHLRVGLLHYIASLEGCEDVREAFSHDLHDSGILTS